MELRGRLKITGLIDHTVVKEAWNRAAPLMAQAIRTRYETNLRGRIVRVRRGELSGSVQATVEPTPSGFVRVRVGAEHFTAAIIEGGAAPHTITAERGRLLRFLHEGRWITTGRVEHPGVAPRRPLATATAESQAEIDRILAEELEAAALRRSRPNIPGVVNA